MSITNFEQAKFRLKVTFTCKLKRLAVRDVRNVADGQQALDRNPVDRNPIEWKNIKQNNMKVVQITIIVEFVVYSR